MNLRRLAVFVIACTICAFGSSYLCKGEPQSIGFVAMFIFAFGYTIGSFIHVFSKKQEWLNQ